MGYCVLCGICDSSWGLVVYPSIKGSEIVENFPPLYLDRLCVKRSPAGVDRCDPPKLIIEYL